MNILSISLVRKLQVVPHWTETMAMKIFYNWCKNVSLPCVCVCVKQKCKMCLPHDTRGVKKIFRGKMSRSDVAGESAGVRRLAGQASRAVDTALDN